MIDREARDKTISAIEEYLDDKITAFEFDERLQEIESDDSTVEGIVRAAWFYYDDCKDHNVILSKQAWDYFQRLLLILKSDAEISSSVTRRWSWDHAFAWAAFAAFVWIAFFVGFGFQLILLAIPFGVVSISISLYRECRLPQLDPHDTACIPFDSFSQIRWLRHQVPTFQKRPYRTELQGRKIRSEAANSFVRMFACCYWLAFSPVVLLFQGLPSRESNVGRFTHA
jgi:hypothetical protein